MKRCLISIISAFLLIPATSGDVWPSEEKPHITDLRLRQGESDVLLSAKLVTEFGEEMKKALRGGVPLTLSYRIRLTRKGSLLGEKIVRRREVIHRLEYDPVKQHYQFTGEGYGREPTVKVTKDEEEALALLTRIVNYRLFPLKRFETDVRYRVRVMATLRSAELPSVLGYIFFFTTIFNQETPWVQLDFIF